MTTSFIQTIAFLPAGIIVIILLTARFPAHAFFGLLIASFVVGFGMQLSIPEIIIVAKQGFGNIMQSWD